MCFRHAHYFLITLSFETVWFAQVNQIPSFFFFKGLDSTEDG